MKQSILVILISIISIYTICSLDIKGSSTNLSRLEKKLETIQDITSFNKDVEDKKIHVQEIIGPVPEKYLDLVWETAVVKYQLDYKLVCAVIHWESAYSWDPGIESPMGAIGLMQIMPRTGELISNSEGIYYNQSLLYKPDYNINMGCWLLRDLLSRFEIDVALAAYNGPYHKALKFRCDRDFSYLSEETKTYIPKVLDIYKRL